MINNGDIVWVVGKTCLENGLWKWEICGIFETEKEAIAICNAPYNFIGPIEFGKSLPEERIAWPGCYYPNIKTLDTE